MGGGKINISKNINKFELYFRKIRNFANTNRNYIYAKTLFYRTCLVRVSHCRCYSERQQSCVA